MEPEHMIESNFSENLSLVQSFKETEEEDDNQESVKRKVLEENEFLHLSQRSLKADQLEKLIQDEKEKNNLLTRGEQKLYENLTQEVKQHSKTKRDLKVINKKFLQLQQQYNQLTVNITSTWEQKYSEMVFLLQKKLNFLKEEKEELAGWLDSTKKNYHKEIEEKNRIFKEKSEIEMKNQELELELERIKRDPRRSKNQEIISNEITLEISHNKSEIEQILEAKDHTIDRLKNMNEKLQKSNSILTNHSPELKIENLKLKRVKEDHELQLDEISKLNNLLRENSEQLNILSESNIKKKKKILHLKQNIDFLTKKNSTHISVLESENEGSKKIENQLLEQLSVSKDQLKKLSRTVRFQESTIQSLHSNNKKLKQKVERYESSGMIGKNQNRFVSEESSEDITPRRSKGKTVGASYSKLIDEIQLLRSKLAYNEKIIREMKKQESDDSSY